MKTAVERVSWALGFEKSELATFREEEWQKLKEEIKEIARRPGDPRTWGPSHLTRENIADMQRDTRSLVNTFGLPALIQKIYKRPNSHGALAWGRPFRTIRGLFFWLEDGEMTVSIDANLTETFLFALATAFTAIDHNAFRICPSCGRPFLAEHGSKIFCTPRCENRKSVRAFRERRRQEKAKMKTAKSPGRVQQQAGS